MSADRDLADPALAELLRTHSAETPPAHVDAAILAAAHRAVEGAPRRAERALARQAWRWWMPLAAAAVIGVVVIGVLPLAPSVVDDTEQIVSDAPVPSRQDQAAEERRAAPEERRSAPAERTAPWQGRRAAPAQPFAEPPVPTSPSPVASAVAPRVEPKSESETPGASARVEPKSEAETSRASSPPMQDADQALSRQRSDNASSTHDAARKQEPSLQDSLAAPRPALREQSAAGARLNDPGGPPDKLTPAEWIARIRALRMEGKEPEALGELARFRTAYADADARLPDDLRAWANSRR